MFRPDDRSRRPATEDTRLTAESTDTPETLPAGARQGRRVRFAPWLAALAIGAPLALVAAAALWMWVGALPLDILKTRMELALLKHLPAGASIAIGPTTITYRRGSGLQLEARNLRLNLPGTGEAEIARLATSARLGSLLAGTPDLESIRIEGAAIRLLSPAGAQPGSTARQMTERFAGAVASVDDRMRRFGFGEGAVADLTISWPDEGAGNRSLSIAEGTWKPLPDQRSKTWIQLVSAESANGWGITLEREPTRDGGSSVSVRVDDLPIPHFVPALGDPDRIPSFNALLEGEARILLNAGGQFAGLRGTVSVGPGALRLSRRSEIQIAGISLPFAMPASADRVTFSGAEITSRTGYVSLSSTADIALDRSSVAIKGRILGGVLPTGEARPAGLHLRDGTIEARLDLQARSLQLDRFEIRTDHGEAALIGNFTWGGHNSGIAGALSVSEMPSSAFRALWPPFIAGKTRQWFDDNVVAGTVGPATLQVSLPSEFIGVSDRALPSYALIGSLPFRDAEFSPLRSFPPIKGALGAIGFADSDVAIETHSGTIAVPGHGDVDATGTVLVVREIGIARPRGDLHLRLAGPAAAIAALSNYPPLTIAAKRGITPSDLSGNLELALEAEIPLSPEDVMQVRPSFRLTLSDFASKAPISGRTITEADLVLEGTPESYTVKGSGKIDGMAATVDLLQGTEALDQTGVTVLLDDAARDRLGLRFGSYITGPVQAAIKELEPGRQEVALDLKEAVIRLPFLGWEKGAGVAATARFDLARTPDGETRIERLAIAGKGVSAKGDVVISPEGKLVSLSLTDLALRAGDKFAVTARPREGGYAVEVKGDEFDARGLIRQLKSGMGETQGGATPIWISLDIGGVVTQGNVVLSGVAGSLHLRGSKVQAAALRGKTGGSGAFEWVVGGDGETRIMRVLADDGGALIRGLGIYDKVGGGRLVIDYRGSAKTGVGTGSLALRSFRVIGETAIAPALQTAAERADESARAKAAQINPADLQFDQLAVPFRRNQWVIGIDEAFLRGSMLGATASGTINLPDRKLAISGTFIPAFGLNNIASAVPFFGGILGGGRNEGLLGITYKLFGPLENPQLAMNPLSAIAPGIFRRIFEYR